MFMIIGGDECKLTGMASPLEMAFATAFVTATTLPGTRGSVPPIMADDFSPLQAQTHPPAIRAQEKRPPSGRA